MSKISKLTKVCLIDKVNFLFIFYEVRHDKSYFLLTSGK